MNWEINLSRPGIQERVQQVRPGMTSAKTISEGVGPKNDFWGAIAYTYFRDVLGYNNIEYGTSTLRKKTSGSLEEIQQSWCENGVSVEAYQSKDKCLSREEGVNVCMKPSRESGKDDLDLQKLSVAELRDMLREMGIEVKSRTRRQQVIDMIEEIFK
jgi:glycogen synthase